MSFQLNPLEFSLTLNYNNEHPSWVIIIIRKKTREKTIFY